MSESDAPQAPVVLDELINTVPHGISALSAHQRDDLAHLIVHARQSRIEELMAAANAALDNLPGFLAGAVRRAAGPIRTAPSGTTEPSASEAQS